MSNVTVYGKPGCRACTMTKRVLDKNNVEYTYVDFTADEEAYATVKDAGVLAAPYVTSPVGDWSGLDESKLNDLIESL